MESGNVILVMLRRVDCTVVYSYYRARSDSAQMTNDVIRILGARSIIDHRGIDDGCWHHEQIEAYLNK